VKTWNILTGHCEKSYKTQIKGVCYADIQSISGRLIIVWSKYNENKIHVWDAGKGKLRNITTQASTENLRVIGDGSRILQLCERAIVVWDIWTGERVWGFEYHGGFDGFQMDGSKVLVDFGHSSVQGWDFGAPGSTPTQFSKISSDRPYLKFIDHRAVTGHIPQIEDSITGKVVLQLYGKYENPSAIQWDGQYLIAGYASGEVLILDFSDALS